LTEHLEGVQGFGDKETCVRLLAWGPGMIVDRRKEPTGLFALRIEGGVSGGDGDKCATSRCHCG
jgi:hypothetical protein